MTASQTSGAERSSRHLVRLENFSADTSALSESSRPVFDRLKTLEHDRSVPHEISLPALNPGEQYRFHFDMTRCIGCRCCEVACNEQNDNPAHVKWRRVGEIEGGSYPHVKRLHLSMSCNHCLEPSCMEGCPVDAYAKIANGIVTHDAEACIGCQYCTWSCPYGVPQYHPERHVVTKCHMCVDRIADGSLPACVEACPTRAIQIEPVNVAAWREAIAGGNAPGVPPADLTYSTTRITLPEGLSDSTGLSESWRLEPEAAHWPLVFLLVLSQWSVGVFAGALAFSLAGADRAARAAAIAAFAVGQLALSASVFHLGKPLHALRAMRAWRRSWLSREAIAFLAYSVFGAAALLASGGPRTGLLVLTVAAGIAGVVSSARMYRIPARPAWDTWRTQAQFALTAIGLGASLLWTIACASDAAGSVRSIALVVTLAAILAATLPWTLVARGLAAEDSPLRGAALLCTRRFQRLLWTRTLLHVAAAFLAFGCAIGSPNPLPLAIAALAAGLAAEIAGRYLFFVTVVPRNMPGHFFSRNSPTHH